jgi:hypothetical protein
MAAGSSSGDRIAAAFVMRLFNGGCAGNRYGREPSIRFPRRMPAE